MDPQSWWARVLDLADNTKDLSRKSTLKEISNKIGLQVIKCKQNSRHCERIKNF